MILYAVLKDLSLAPEITAVNVDVTSTLLPLLRGLGVSLVWLWTLAADMS